MSSSWRNVVSSSWHKYHVVRNHCPLSAWNPFFLRSYSPEQWLFLTKSFYKNILSISLFSGQATCSPETSSETRQIFPPDPPRGESKFLKKFRTRRGVRRRVPEKIPNTTRSTTRNTTTTTTSGDYDALAHSGCFIVAQSDSVLFHQHSDHETRLLLKKIARSTLGVPSRRGVRINISVLLPKTVSGLGPGLFPTYRLDKRFLALSIGQAFSGVALSIALSIGQTFGPNIHKQRPRIIVVQRHVEKVGRAR